MVIYSEWFCFATPGRLRRWLSEICGLKKMCIMPVLCTIALDRTCQCLPRDEKLLRSVLVDPVVPRWSRTYYDRPYIMLSRLSKHGPNHFTYTLKSRTDVHDRTCDILIHSYIIHIFREVCPINEKHES